LQLPKEHPIVQEVLHAQHGVFGIAIGPDGNRADAQDADKCSGHVALALKALGHTIAVHRVMWQLPKRPAQCGHYGVAEDLKALDNSGTRQGKPLGN